MISQKIILERIKYLELLILNISGSVSEGDISSVTKTFYCDSSANVGDVVFLSKNTNNKIIVNNTNTQEIPSIGVIELKITDTICKVICFGYTNNKYGGLKKSKKVFLSSTGSLTTTKPVKGYIQVLGFCYETDQVFICPELLRVKQNPFV